MKAHTTEEHNFTPAPSKYNEYYIALTENRTIFLTEDITKDVASSLSALLLYYNHQSPTKDIKIYINCNGGDSAGLINIYDVMNLIKAPISTICVGKAFSAGAFILAAGTKGKRFITKNATVMIHGIQCFFPSNPVADQKDSEIYLKYLKNHNDTILKILAKHTGHSIKKITEDCKRDNFMTAKEALKYNMVDRII